MEISIQNLINRLSEDERLSMLRKIVSVFLKDERDGIIHSQLMENVKDIFDPIPELTSFIGLCSYILSLQGSEAHYTLQGLIIDVIEPLSDKDFFGTEGWDHRFNLQDELVEFDEFDELDEEDEEDGRE